MGTQLSSEGLGFCYQLDTYPAPFGFSLFLGDDLLPRILPFSYLNGLAQTSPDQRRPASKKREVHRVGGRAVPIKNTLLLSRQDSCPRKPLAVYPKELGECPGTRPPIYVLGALYGHTLLVNDAFISAWICFILSSASASSSTFSAVDCGGWYSTGLIVSPLR